MDGNCLMICHASTVILARIIKLLPPPTASAYLFATPIALKLWGARVSGGWRGKRVDYSGADNPPQNLQGKGRPPGVDVEDDHAEYGDG